MRGVLAEGEHIVLSLLVVEPYLELVFGWVPRFLFEIPIQFTVTSCSPAMLVSIHLISVKTIFVFEIDLGGQISLMTHMPPSCKIMRPCIHLFILEQMLELYGGFGVVVELSLLDAW